MLKLRFDLDRLLARKPEDQKVASPVETELNEQELATVTGGWGGGGGGCCGGGGWWHRRRRRRWWW